MKTMNYISSFWGRLASSSLCELVDLVGDMVSWPDVDVNPGPGPGPGPDPDPDTHYHYRDRVFNPWRTFWLFLGQVLSVTQTCREALRKAQAWLCLNKKKSHPGHLPTARRGQELDRRTWILSVSR